MAVKLKIDVRKYRPKGGESHEDVLKRAITFIKQVSDRLLSPQSKEEHSVLVVTHGGFISEFQNACRVIVGRPLQNTPSANNTSVYVISMSRNAKGNIVPKLVVANDT